MTKELIINVTQEGFRIALLQDGNLLEYHVDKKDRQFTVGDIYLGTVKKLANSLNASFVDIGYKKDAFLHYADLGSQFSSQRQFMQLLAAGKDLAHDLNQFNLLPTAEKPGKIAELLTKNQAILVQIAKEPISSKGPRLSAALSLAGRYMILVPFTNAIHVSKKILDSKERNRLVRLITSIKPNNFGIIIRTVAKGKAAAKLDQDLKDLLEKWKTGINKLKKAHPKDKIIGEVNRASSMLRDLLNDSFDSILVDDQPTHEEIKQYIQKIAPEQTKIIKHYQGKTKLFERYGVEKQLKTLFGQTVNLPSGGYLVVEHTEAMHVIDVNSGSKVTKEVDQEKVVLEINLAAAQETARQLRLRDMGGIIVVDFIDMKEPEHKRELHQKMKDYLKEDRSKTTTLPISRFGLMQITRQRVRPEMNIMTQEQCPSCGGTGQIDAAIAIAEQIENSLQLVLVNQNERSLTLFVHPYLYAYFTAGWFSKRVKWLLRYKQWVKLAADSSLGITEFQCFNKQGEVLDLQP